MQWPMGHERILVLVVYYSSSRKFQTTSISKWRSVQIVKPIFIPLLFNEDKYLQTVMQYFCQTKYNFVGRPSMSGVEIAAGTLQCSFYFKEFYGSKQRLPISRRV